MKLWTIQNEGAYEKFKDTRILRANDRFICEDMIFHYNWIADQMKKRIGLLISEKIKYPIWVWYQWNGIKHKKPDLRFSGHLEKGTKGVLLELEVEPQNALLSDFQDFNNVLNYGYISDSEEEYDSFYNELERYGYSHYNLQSADKKSDILDEYKLRLYESWEKIFDLESEGDERWSGKKEDQSIQATMWEVRWEQVVSVKHFIAK
ncbi:DUF3841 domain-containing protein [Clostridium saccharobutylicum]|uniref:DUF3841 domain-containing protein n=1 Tax=Clostridium saccharobutylicum DSM 13864 TaxID=1345695 RepID=U5MTJ9_CLOSA|nr:DUF3841 domain-containing protein [Clostridium saccharobutylicum]AGX43885.1 hypothetical protein CLSA_c29180 [Clostridium saccharobutylicum DSM 13864]AQR91183.1 hypothetical protein CLOSC_29070 [Clostridium saccharobutylicum]AQS01087.1 hypothetical protein CSACC_29140 [Clostridium saccharobutylicum]AQS15070.1 hypothetical protein CLOSACC_29140 [Clostridium saccharobutylicum]MBA2905195.1 hypothetical protein [Clostridium saccharobutylicum]